MAADVLYGLSRAFTFAGRPARDILVEVETRAGKKAPVFIVGGVLRDALAGRAKRDPDIDFALPSGSLSFARRIARSLKAGFVALDEERGTARVVVRGTEDIRTLTLDFSDFKGKSIEEDLARRDFTVNAMAVPLSALIAGKRLDKILIDPAGGRRDLLGKTVREVSPEAFDEDPLRVLRGFSTAAVLGFGIEKKTLVRIERKRGLLSGVSPERIRDEFFKVLSSPDSGKYVGLLDRHGVLEKVLPEIRPMKRMRQGDFHHLDVWGHTLETLRALEHAGPRLMRASAVREFLAADISSGRSRWQLLKLAALLHDCGKPATYRKSREKITFYGHDRVGAAITASAGRRIRLSNEEERSLRRIVAMHLRPGFLATAPRVTAKAIFRFFRDAGQDAGSILVLSLADLRATRGYKLVERTRDRNRRLVKRLLRDFFRRRECPPAPRLVTGHDLIAAGLEPSPLFGTVLREIEELQAAGEITNREEGLSAARRIVCRLGRRKKKT